MVNNTKNLNQNMLSVTKPYLIKQDKRWESTYIKKFYTIQSTMIYTHSEREREREALLPTSSQESFITILKKVTRLLFPKFIITSRLFYPIYDLIFPTPNTSILQSQYAHKSILTLR